MANAFPVRKLIQGIECGSSLAANKKRQSKNLKLHTNLSLGKMNNASALHANVETTRTFCRNRRFPSFCWNAIIGVTVK